MENAQRQWWDELKPAAKALWARRKSRNMLLSAFPPTREVDPDKWDEQYVLVPGDQCMAVGRHLSGATNRE